MRQAQSLSRKLSCGIRSGRRTGVGQEWKPAGANLPGCCSCSSQLRQSAWEKQKTETRLLRHVRARIGRAGMRTLRAVGTGVLLCAVLSATLLPDLAVAQDSAGDPTVSAKLVDYILKVRKATGPQMVSRSFAARTESAPRSARWTFPGTYEITTIVPAMQKSWDEFVTELQREDMDANQPSPTGKLPLCEAVKTRELKYVDALIQHGVTVSVKEPYTGASPILIAFQNNLPDVSMGNGSCKFLKHYDVLQPWHIPHRCCACRTCANIARMLLAYGADPEAQAKNGKSAKDVSLFLFDLPAVGCEIRWACMHAVASSAAIKDLLDRWMKDGPMAFEDKPGTWVKATSATHDQSEYWYNKDTQVCAGAVSVALHTCLVG
eukprot:354622-Chlamydomonas_euryale.AAC.11